MEAPEKTTIDGLEFTLPQLPAWDHAEATMRLTKILGTGIAPVISIFGKLDLESDKIDMKVIGIIINILQDAPVRDVMDLMKMLIPGCTVKGDLQIPGTKLSELGPVFNTVLKGRPLTTWKLLGWVLKVHFASFFAELVRVIPKPDIAQAQTKTSPSSESQSPSEDTGPAADSSPTDGQASQS